MPSYQVRFYERTERGRLKVLKSVTLPGVRRPSEALSWATAVLEQTTPELTARLVEVRVAMVEAATVVPVPVQVLR